MALPIDRISPIKFLPADVEVEPVYNALNSLALLNILEQLPNLPPWIVRSAEALTTERREENHLVFEGLGYILTPERDYSDFPTYINDLATTDPIVLRDRHLSRLIAALPGPLEYGNAILSVDQASLLRNVQSYISYVKQLNPTLPIDPIMQQKVYHLLLDPEALQKTLVAHLRLMWKALLAPEWKRMQRSLQAQVAIYKECLDPSSTTQELFRLFTGRDLLRIFPLRATAIERVILIPTPHNGRYVTQWLSAGSLRLFFTAPANFGLALRPASMDTQELHARLKGLADALADETRLRILELFIRHDQLIAQDLMEYLDISQSSISRHLKQLVHAGYLLEKREGANKVYAFNALSFDSTIRALELLKTGAVGEIEARSDQRESLPRELKRFVDAQGRVTTWPPARQKDKQLILEYLITKFDIEQVYSEKEVNQLLAQYIAFRDFVSLRRELFDQHLLDRTPDGSEYRRV